MTALRTAAQQALEALEEYQSTGAPCLACDGAVAALRAALAQQAEPVQEPVAWMRHDNRVAEESYSRTQFSRGRDKPPIGTWTPLYPAPPQRKPLTQEEIDRICASLGFAAISPSEIVRAVERAHGIGETK